MSRLSSLFLALIVFPLLSASSGAPRLHPAILSLPARMVWGWERAEDLRWLPADAGVAYVATVIELDGRKLHYRPRTRPLQVRDDTALIPVIHVDALWHPSPSLTLAQRDAIVKQVLTLAPKGNRKVVQLDFEVRLSQRAFWLEVVRQIRRQLPPDYALSVTALASWCAWDYWLEDLPADEIVPMTFRMGDDDGEIRQMLLRKPFFAHANCRVASGQASDELALKLYTMHHYFFSPQSWEPSVWRTVQTQSHY